MLAENEEDTEALFRAPISRTCVFIAGDGGSARRLNAVVLSPMGHPMTIAVTPAGLFACWPVATSWLTLDQWAPVLDQLMDLADRENVSPPIPTNPDGDATRASRLRRAASLTDDR